MALNAKTDPTMFPNASTANSLRGWSGNPGGSLEGTRRSFNKDFLLALAADFKKHGAAAIEKVRKQQPAAYMKICALLVPSEMKVEHSCDQSDVGRAARGGDRVHRGGTCGESWRSGQGH